MLKYNKKWRGIMKKILLGLFSKRVIKRSDTYFEGNGIVYAKGEENPYTGVGGNMK